MRNGLIGADRDVNPSRSNRISRIIRRVSVAVIIIISLSVLGLQVYSSIAIRDNYVPRAVAAELDSRGRDEAFALRKKLLAVRGAPYAPQSSEILRPFSDESHQRRIEAAFRDPESGLMIHAETHLCLPGVDPCISGGSITVSDESSEWQVTFQLLGAERPSDFQASVPKSRRLFDRLKSLPHSALAPECEDYRDALSAALDSEADSTQQHRAVRHLLDLLLASFFVCDDYASTRAFAESESLIN